MFDELIHGSPFYNGNTEEEVFSKIKYEVYQIRDDSVRCATVFEG
jgi:calcium-dependent protein kinase